jgi:DNA-binding transcriptional regulator YiaG
VNNADFRRIREGTGLTQAQMAKFLRVDEATVRRYEAEKVKGYSRLIPGPVSRLLDLIDRGLIKARNLTDQ